MDANTPPPEAKPGSFKQITGWVAGIAAILGLLTTLLGGAQWLKDHWTQHGDIKAELAVAESQAQRDEYQAAVATYQNILKEYPQNKQAADAQITAAMRWVENFSVLTKENESATNAAAPQLDTILPILDAGFPRAKGPRAADILAHIGWVHWLNRHIAEREFGPAAEQNLRQALTIDPSNVYANAMLGNWLLQNNGSLQEAVSHFTTAVNSGKERPWVRTMQLGGLIYNQRPHARTELIRVVNDMRKNNEPLSDDEKSRILSSNYYPPHYVELREALTAVPPDESWATYQWLDAAQAAKADTGEYEIKTQQLRSDYIHASILEIAGKQSEALSQYKLLQTKLNPDSTLLGLVNDAIKRLTARKA